jgi:hypothetical protein
MLVFRREKVRQATRIDPLPLGPAPVDHRRYVDRVSDDHGVGHQMQAARLFGPFLGLPVYRLLYKSVNLDADA